MKKILLLFVAIAALTACGQKEEAKQPVVQQVNKKEVALDNLMTRRSIHAYKADQVSKAQIDTIMKCAILAPSANNKQPWEVRIVQNPDMLKKLNDIKSVFYNAPTFIFVARDVNNPTSASDCGMLSQNILLSAHAMGLGTCVIGSIVPVINDPKAKEVKDALQFSEGYEIMYGIALGYGNETPQVKDRDATKVKYID